MSMNPPLPQGLANHTQGESAPSQAVLTASMRAELDAIADGRVDPDEPKPIDVPLMSGQPEMLFQNQYVWFILLAAMDVMFTWVILAMGGNEVNYLADRVIAHRGLPGLIVFKFALVIFVVLMCEQVGRRKRKLGRSLAEWSVAISSVPLIVGAVQVFVWTWFVAV